MKIIYENCGVKNYRKKIIAVIDATFSFREVSARVILASGLKPGGYCSYGLYRYVPL